MIILLLLTVILTTINEGGGADPDSPYIWKIRHRKHHIPEKAIWGNPCNWANRTRPVNPYEDLIKPSEYAHYAVMAVSVAQRELARIKERFVKAVYNGTSFTKMNKKFRHVRWLRLMPWYIPEVLPANKEIFGLTPKHYLNGLMRRLPRVLPRIHKGFKMVIAGLRMVAYHGICMKAVNKDRKLRPDFDRAIRLVRKALCKFTEYVDKLGLKKIWMYRLEEPTLDKDGNKTFLIYRDAVNYLQYLDEVLSRVLLEPDKPK